MEFRELNSNDLESLLEIYVELKESNSEYSLEDSKKIWNDLTQTGIITYFGAIDNKEVISTCFLAIIPSLTNQGKPIGYIENFVTKKEYRRKGIGKKIIEIAIQKAKEENCFRIFLQSGINRVDAHKFYANMGFNGQSKKAYELRL